MFWDVFARFWMFWGVLGHFLDILRCFWSIWDFLGLFGTFWDIFGHFWTILDHTCPLSLGADSKDYSALRHFKNCNLTSEVPHISTRWHQTPDEGIGTLTDKCAAQEVLKKVLMVFCTGCLCCLFSVAR